MEILFCPWRLLGKQLGENQGNAAAVISATVAPEASRLPSIPYVLRVYEDIDAPIPGRAFSEVDAKAFGDFIRGLSSTVDTLYCCCDMAKSRSPAVAAAACRYFGKSDRHIWSDPYLYPNMLVFDMLTTALGIPLTDEEKDALLQENRAAFRKAIHK